MNLTFAALAAVTLLAASTTSQGADQPTPPPPKPSPAAATPRPRLPPIRYTIPPGTAEYAKERVSSGTRGSTDESGNPLPYLEVLVPNHVGLTVQAQPILYWYQSAPARFQVELALIEPKRVKPIARINLGPARQAGIHSFSLRQAGLSLQPNVTYRWSVSMVVDKDQRSADVFAAGKIKCMAPPAGWAEKLAGATLPERAALCAGAGLWYDALEDLDAAIAQAPAVVELRAQRAALLKREGLRAR